MIYAAACGGVLVVAHKSRSLQIVSAANLLIAGWFLTLTIWRWVPAEFRLLGYAPIDLVLAGAFFFMSRGRWFPVPLFFLHGALVIYDVYGLMVGTGPVWIAAFLNRTFELELAYVLFCALFRISKISENEKGAP